MLRSMLSAIDVARRFDLHRNTVEKWLKNGRLKGVKVGRRYLIPEEEIERLTKTRIVRCRRWTAEEVNILKSSYGLPKEEVLKLLPRRSYDSIIKKAQELGIVWKPIFSSYDLTDFDLGFIIGLIEGEGTLTISVARGYGRPLIQIANTDLELINKTSTLLGTGFTIRDARKGRKTAYYLKTSSIHKIMQILTKLRPYFVSERKRKLCDLLLEYCKLRETHYLKKGKKFGTSTREEEIIREVRMLNSSTNTRNREG